MMRISKIILLALALLVALGGAALAASSANYSLLSAVLSSGGGERTSASYRLVDTAGQPAAGAATSASYRLSAGYWHEVEAAASTPVLTTIPVSARAVVAGDTRGDGQVRIVVGSYNTGDIRIFRWEGGSYIEEWSTCVLEGSQVYPLAVGDADNDGKPEFLVTIWPTPGMVRSGKIYMYRWTGNTYQQVLVQSLGGNYMPAAIADLDGDGKNELIIDTGKLSVYRYSSPTGQFESVWSAPEGNLIQLSIGDVDGDGKLEAVGAFPWAGVGKLMVIGYSGTGYAVEAMVTGFPKPLGGACAADLDGDGTAEIVTATYNVAATEFPIFIVKHSGTGYSVQEIYKATCGMFQIHAGDVDGDGVAEASILNNASGWFLVKYQSPGYQVSVGTWDGACNIGDVADVDRDGLAEVLGAAMGGVNIVDMKTGQWLVVDQITSPVVAGTASNVRVTAIQNGATKTDYAGTVHFTSTDALAALPANYTFLPTDSGIKIFGGLTFNTVGNQRVTVTDTASGTITGTSAIIKVNPVPLVTLPLPGGQNVPVPDPTQGVSLLFDNVTTAADVSVSVTSQAPVPTGDFTFLNRYYDVSTQATYSGNVAMTITYNDADVPAGQSEASLRLYHWDGQAWQDVTVLPVDTVNNRITGRVTSLSWLAVGIGPDKYYLTVNSAYGTAGGQGWYNSGSTATANVTPLVVAGPAGTRYVFTGWSGDASGATSPSNPIVMDANKTATANWKTQYRLTVNTDPSGLSPAPTANPASSDGFYDAGTQVTLTANAVSGCTFNYWSVDGSNQTLGVDRITVAMNGPRNAVANYVRFTMAGHFTDSDFNPISSFDVVFTPSTGTSYKMVATNPGTFRYNLQITNNGASGNFAIQVNIPGDFVLKPVLPGAQPVQIDGTPVIYTSAGGVLSVSNVAIGTGQTVKLTVHLDYALKFQYTATQPYTATSPTTYLKQYSFSTMVNLVKGKAATIVATGKKVTVIGGFVTDVNGAPKNGLRVTVTDARGGTTNVTTGSMGDGFYFLIVPAGGPYKVEIFNSLDTPVAVRNNIQVAQDTFVEVGFNQLNPADPTIQGFVRDSSANPVARATVELVAVNGKVVATTVTNNGGYYVFRFSPPGTYTVRITVPSGYGTTTTSVNIKVAQFQIATVNFILTKK